MLNGKNILLGITGSIAAYKAAILVRMLVKKGAHVKVVMTPLAREFITPLTLATLAKNPVLVDFYNPENGDWNSHVDLGLWADLYLIAPASANTLAKMAHGIADNLLLTSFLSARCPVVVSPAMDLDMFRHQATQDNLKILRMRGNLVIEPSTGELASGLEGKGRMEEPEKITSFLESFFSEKEKQDKEDSLLKGKKFLVTAGPTYEAIDPVRFIGNYSSGKMGFAIAEELADSGADVILVSGPVYLETSHPAIKRIDVISASEMYNACKEFFPECDGAVLSAAVADYTFEKPFDRKVKDKSNNLDLHLSPTMDIAASLGKTKRKDQILAGFALETHDELKNAQEKLEKKNFDFIVLNSLNTEGAGFHHDTNQITIIHRDNNIRKFELKQKKAVAADIIKTIISIIQK